MNGLVVPWLNRLFAWLFGVTAALSFGMGAALAAGRLLPGSVEIAYTVYENTEPEIYRFDLSRHLRHNLTRRAGYDAAPIWSPDGKWIVFASDRDGPVNIYVMNALGREVRLLSRPDNHLFFHTVRWAADGERMYLFHGALNDLRIFSVRLDGSEFEELTTAATAGTVQRDYDLDPNNLSMSISPDGQRSAFVAYRRGVWGLYLGDEQRRNAEWVAPAGRQYSEPPIWSRDGSQVAYVAMLRDTIDLYILNPNTIPPRVEQLTHDRAIESGISWRPQGR
jgi:Tol biopolymer transport system component